jgi:hypothetical protein
MARLLYQHGVVPGIGSKPGFAPDGTRQMEPGAAGAGVKCNTGVEHSLRIVIQSYSLHTVEPFWTSGWNCAGHWFAISTAKPVTCRSWRNWELGVRSPVSGLIEQETLELLSQAC